MCLLLDKNSTTSLHYTAIIYMLLNFTLPLYCIEQLWFICCWTTLCRDKSVARLNSATLLLCTCVIYLLILIDYTILLHFTTIIYLLLDFTRKLHNDIYSDGLYYAKSLRWTTKIYLLNILCHFNALYNCNISVF